MTDPTAPAGAVVRFGPAVDRWIVWVLGFSVVAMGAAVVAVVLDPDTGWVEAAISVATVLGTLGIVWLLAWPVAYEVDLEEVRVRAGVLRYRIALRDLVRLELRTSVVSSTTAAWTLRRLLLVDRQGHALEVGPADRLGFVAEVLARAPQLVEDRRAPPGRAWHDPARARR